MNAEELIIGHYENTLSPAEQGQLKELLAASPEARVLFERYGGIESMMHEEAEQIAPSKELDRAVVAAALGVLAHGAAGGFISGILGSALGKVAVVATTIVAGGIVAGVIGGAFDGDAPETEPNPAAAPSSSVQQRPAFELVLPTAEAIQQAANAIAEESARMQLPAHGDQPSAATSSDAAEVPVAAARSASDAAASSTPSTPAASTSTESTRPPIEFGGATETRMPPEEPTILPSEERGGRR